ncbi:unnamed protein product [Lactuca saligna]|uniref:Uncharacterized protein n=1 Tax=Lactuca saligna TaxID=75948 RepID=A0AA35YEU0_LACSI|nr:unnamed protein product [Lactuca saligna]
MEFSCSQGEAPSTVAVLAKSKRKGGDNNTRARKEKHCSPTPGPARGSKRKSRPMKAHIHQLKKERLRPIRSMCMGRHIYFKTNNGDIEINLQNLRKNLPGSACHKIGGIHHNLNPLNGRGQQNESQQKT